MPASAKQIAANRQNAQQSTGPRTIAGKVRSSQNATTHGLYSEANIINSPHLKESYQDYAELLQGITDELKPAGFFETQLVHTICNCLWRQRRA
ncbi:hypothetical protein JYU03_00415, partial [bacterium AH-315-F03]|nr:hypothetical protein [bacterium AH-315-F03]